MGSREHLKEKIMLKKITFGVLFLVLAMFFYLVFIFDINNYKSQLENIISEQTNTEFTISGNLELDVGISTRIKAELLSVQKNNVLILEAEVFTADVSLSQFLQAKFDINSISLIDSKLYGVDVDDEEQLEVVIHYDDNRRVNRTWHVPLLNNKFIIFPSMQRFFIKGNQSSKLQTILISTYEYI